MSANTAGSDAKAELISLAFAIIARAAGVKIKAGGAQPLDRYIFERVPDAKDPQRPAGESRAFVLWGLGIFKLQRPLAGVPVSPTL